GRSASAGRSGTRARQSLSRGASPAASCSRVLACMPASCAFTRHITSLHPPRGKRRAGLFRPRGNLTGNSLGPCRNRFPKSLNVIVSVRAFGSDQPRAWRLRVNGDHDTTPMFQADAEAPAQPEVPQAAAAGEQPTVSSPELARILASIGEACYEGEIASDVLAWRRNAASVVPVADLTEISSGRLFARLLDGDNIQTRFDAVMHSVHRDEGHGVPYQVEYCMRVGSEPSRVWFEDTGRWFGSGDGRPVRAHGVVRVINERHAQQERLAFLSRYDSLTGEMNRWHLTDVLSEALQDSIRFRASCGFLLIAI